MMKTPFLVGAMPDIIFALTFIGVIHKYVVELKVHKLYCTSYPFSIKKPFISAQSCHENYNNIRSN